MKLTVSLWMTLMAGTFFGCGESKTSHLSGEGQVAAEVEREDGYRPVDFDELIGQKYYSFRTKPRTYQGEDFVETTVLRDEFSLGEFDGQHYLEFAAYYNDEILGLDLAKAKFWVSKNGLNLKIDVETDDAEIQSFARHIFVRSKISQSALKSLEGQRFDKIGTKDECGESAMIKKGVLAIVDCKGAKEAVDIATVSVMVSPNGKYLVIDHVTFRRI